jgi:hypothetical protein
MISRRPCARLVLCLLALSFVLPIAAFAENATVTVINKSDWSIEHFFLSSSEEEEWGPDQLGEEVIGTDESFKLNNIPCDTYDVQLIDEAGDECIVPEVDICGAKQSWTITNKILLACQENS